MHITLIAKTRKWAAGVLRRSRVGRAKPWHVAVTLCAGVVVSALPAAAVCCVSGVARSMRQSGHEADLPHGYVWFHIAAWTLLAAALCVAAAVARHVVNTNRAKR